MGDVLEVRASPIAGQGLFATDQIPTGAVVARPAGPVHESGHLNHACDPNLGWSGEELVALRAIDADEEVVVDYALSVADPDFFLRCHCPSTRCRQMVEGTDWQIPVLQRRYAGRFHPAVQALIDAAT
jgi:SET domain-containing protein